MLDCKNCKYSRGHIFTLTCGKALVGGYVMGHVYARAERSANREKDCGPDAKFYYPKNPTELEKIIFVGNENYEVDE